MLHFALSAARAALGRFVAGGLVPNAPIGALCASGLVVETALLARDPFGPLSAGPLCAVSALAVLAWLWITLGWGVYLATRLVRGSRATRLAALAGLAVSGFAVGVLYAVSWWLFVRTGQFATCDMAGLLIAFVPQTDVQLTAVAMNELASGVVPATLGGAAVPVVLLLIARTSAPASAGRAGRTWLAVTTSVTALCLVAALSPAWATSQGEIFKLRLHPLATMALSALDPLIGERPTSCLDTSRLEARGPVLLAPPSRPRAVVLLKIESMRADELFTDISGEPLMPNLRRLAAEGTWFTRAYAPATHTDYSDPAVHTSHVPVLGTGRCDYGMNAGWDRTTISSVLHDQGYKTGFFSSADLSWGNQEAALRNGVDDFVDARSVKREHPDGAPAWDLEDALMTEVAIRWIEAHAAEPFVATLDFQSPHFPYHIGAGAETPCLPVPTGLEPGDNFSGYPVARTPLLRNAYRNALRHVDRQIGRVVAALAARGLLDSAVIAVWSDHGQMFREQESYVTHAREPFEPAIRVPFIVRAPDLAPVRRDDGPVSTLDLAPTVLHLLGMKRHPSFQGFALFSAERPRDDERLIFATVDTLASADAVILGGRFKVIHSRGGGRTWAYDLAVDPEERRPLAADALPELERARAALVTWRREQLAYYGFADYYERFFPPRTLGGSAETTLSRSR